MGRWWLAARVVVVGLVLLIVATALQMVARRPAQTERAFANPILQGGQDPSVVYAHGSYYLVQSDGSRITVYRASTLPALASGTQAIVDEVDCCDVWAPELVPLDGRWYIYYSASSGSLATHRMYVLESVGADAMGPYRYKGEIAAETDRWAIDGTVLQLGGARYFIWSGWPSTANTQQNLYIARMSNPWTISGDRHLLSAPTQPWERATQGPHIGVEEGPEVLQHAGRTFLVYSANGSWTDNYCLGLLTYTGGNVTSAGSWKKSSGCVFAKNMRGGVYGPGHNSFTRSPDGTQYWLVYHADAQSGAGWSGRSVRAQLFTWNADGTPAFGTPVAAGTRLAAPSGG